MSWTRSRTLPPEKYKKKSCLTFWLTLGAFGAFTTAGFGGDGATTASVDKAQMSEKIYARELKTSNQEKRSGELWEGSHQLNSQKVARLCNLYHHHRHISRKTYTLLDIGLHKDSENKPVPRPAHPSRFCDPNHIVALSCWTPTNTARSNLWTPHEFSTPSAISSTNVPRLLPLESADSLSYVCWL